MPLTAASGSPHGHVDSGRAEHTKPTSRELEHLPPALRAKARSITDARLQRDLAELGVLRAEADRLLEAFIRTEPRDSTHRAEALLKLAELRWERAHEQWMHALADWENKPTATRGAAPKLDLRAPRALVTEVVERYPTYANYDLALYVRGSLASEEGDENLATQSFYDLLARFPQSRFAPEAHLALGESAFSANARSSRPDWTKPLAEYEKVLRYGNGDLYVLALFKSAWCLWRLDRAAEAAKRFTEVIELASKGPRIGASRAAFDSLEDEAVQALVDMLLQDQNTSGTDAYAFLVRTGSARFAGRIMGKLAGAYEEDGRFEHAIESWELLHRLAPLSAESTPYLLALARAHVVAGNDELAVTTYATLLDAHLPPGVPELPTGPGKPSTATWANAQSDPAVVKRGAAAIETELRARALEVHARGQATRNPNDFVTADRLYQLWLTRFRRDPHAYEMLFYAAEVEFHRLGKDREAARDYLACARLDPKGNFTRDALFNALTALEKIRSKELEADKGKVKGETETDAQFAEALSLYASAHPDAPEVPGFLLAHGIAYHDRKGYGAAIRIFGDLLTRYPESSEAQAAGDRMLDALVHANDVPNLEHWARTLKPLAAYASSAQQRRLDGLILQALFKQGENLAASGKHAAAAETFLRAAREFSRDERAAKACVNSVIEAQKAGELGTAQDAANLALESFSQAPEAPEAIRAIADTLRSAGLLLEAAGYDEQLVLRWPRSPHAREAAFNAVVTRTALGQHALAVKAAQDYQRLFGSADIDDAGEVTFLLGKAHEKAGKRADAIAVYAGYVARAKNVDHKLDALVRLAELRLAIKDLHGADEALRLAVQIAKAQARTLREGKIHAAHARYMQGERLVAAYDAITLDASGPELPRRLARKKELLKEAGSIFADCAKMGAAEWTTAALYRIGYVFEGFAQALRAAHPPPSASPEEQEKFRELVDPIAEQFVEKAIDAYDSGWKKALELKIVNRWTAEMRRALGRLNDVEYPPLRELGLEVRSAGPAPLPALLTDLVP